MYCIGCGNELPSAAAFCAKCGRPAAVPEHGAGASPVARTAMSAPRAGKRNPALRLLFTLMLLALPPLVAFAAATGAASDVDPANYATYEEYDAALVSATDGVGGAVMLISLIALAFACTRVGYRWWDFAFALIPFYGIFFICRIAWRVANLPHRDWPERPGAVPTATYA